MKLSVLAFAVLLATVASGADRHKLDIDPESEDGILLQRIEQEPVPDRKLAFLEKYADQYPKATSIAWVYEQLLSIYVTAKRWDNAMATAQSLLALDPDDLTCASSGLQAAEALKNLELTRKYALASWDAASKVALAPKPADADEAADWAKQVEFANQAALIRGVCSGVASGRRSESTAENRTDPGPGTSKSAEQVPGRGKEKHTCERGGQPGARGRHGAARFGGRSQ